MPWPGNDNPWTPPMWSRRGHPLGHQRTLPRPFAPGYGAFPGPMSGGFGALGLARNDFRGNRPLDPVTQDVRVAWDMYKWHSRHEFQYPQYPMSRR